MTDQQWTLLIAVGAPGVAFALWLLRRWLRGW